MHNAENTTERLLTDAELDAVSGGHPLLFCALVGEVAAIVISGWDNGPVATI